MAPIKFEEDIKQRMEQRHIEPSEASWDVLSKKLEAENNTRKQPIYWWLGIAASIVGVLLVTTFFFKASEIDGTNLKTVATEENGSHQAPLSSEAEVKDFKKELQHDILNASENASEVAEIPKSSLPQETNPTKLASQKPVQQPSEENFAMTKLASNEKEKGEAAQKIYHEESSMTLVAEIDIQNTEAENFSEDEIDHLLKQAEDDILKQRLSQASTKTVNASTLLQDVEADLEHSFRAKVFDALKSSYETVKTAVAQRNN